LGSRALALAAVGRLDHAEGLTAEIRGCSHGVEAGVLIPAVDAVVSLKRGESQAIDHVADFERAAFSSGALDLLVTAYRSVPELLAVLLKSSKDQERLVTLIQRASDEDLARAVGHPVMSDVDAKERLSPRERDVYELLRQGLTNRQIAELLFISESTAKLHAHHIYDKLGVRSRTALAVHAAVERSTQATSATSDSDDEVDS
jgi:DNA-binding NarL/FixJ family response regulator